MQAQEVGPFDFTQEHSAGTWIERFDNFSQASAFERQYTQRESQAVAVAE